MTRSSERRSVITVASALLTAGVLGAALAPGAGAAGASTGTPRPGSSVMFTDGPNTYRVYTPKGFRPGQSLPLYVMVHGCDTNATEQEGANLLDPLADRQHFVVLYADHDQQQNTDPGTHPGRCWHFYSPADIHRGQGDPATIARQTQAVTQRWGVDRSRVYLVGMSSGGMMTSDVAGAYPDVYAAIGVVAGCAYAAGAPCLAGVATDTDGEAQAAHTEQGPRARVVPVIALQGDHDQTVSPANNMLVVQQWLKTGNLALSGTLTAPLPLTPAGSAVRSPAGRYSYTDERYRDGTGHLVAQRVFIAGMDHFWPGGTTDPAYAGYTDPKAPSGAVLTWQFLSRYRLVGGATVDTGS